jgi:hypothetical protein
MAVLEKPLASLSCPTAVPANPVADEFVPHSVEFNPGPSLHSGVGSARAGVGKAIIAAIASGAAAAKRL